MPTPFAIGVKLQDQAVDNLPGTTVNVKDLPAVLVEVVGIGSAIVNFEGAGSSGTIRATSAVETVSRVLATSASQDGLYVVDCVGLETLRTRISSYSTGTITITLREPLSYSVASLISPVQTTTTSTLLQGGAPITGQTLEAGGSAGMGWLSSLRKAISDRLPAQGQALMAGSLPVTLASNQSTLPITFPADQLVHATNLDAALSTRATEATLALIKAKTDNLDATISSLVTATAAALAAGEAHIGAVGGTTTIVSDEFARVSDGNAYAAGDAIGATVSDSGTTALRALTNVARVNQGSGYLTKFRLWTDQKTCVAAIRVHFYTVAAPTTAVVGDNVPMTLYWTNRAQRLGTVDLPALATETDSTNSTAAHTIDLTTRLAFTCAAATRNIFYRLETLTAFTPASGQNFYLEIACEAN